MKKLALGFLSVFMILGGVLLSACDTKVSLSLLTSEEVTIVTNDETAENYGKYTVEAKVENSSEGIRAEVLEGNDVVKLSSISAKSDGRYSFDIETLETQKSGKAKVKLSSVEDQSQSKIVYVNVDTVLDDLQEVEDDNADAKSNRYVVKSGQSVYSIDDRQITTLNVKDYFEFNPITANVYDIVWTFEDGSVSIVDGDDVLALIDGNKIWVSSKYNLQTITLKATDTKKGANNVVEFDVIDNSTIQSFILGGQEIYKDGVINISDPVSFNLVRNNINLSNISGELVVNTQYDISLVPSIRINGIQLSRAEWLEYFTIDIEKPERDAVNNQTTYSFIINAYDALVYNKFGDIKLDFNIEYNYYSHYVDSGADITLKTYCQATGVEVLNASGESLKDGSISVFSNYVDVEGYLIRTILMPDDVGLIDDSYWIVFEENPTYFSTFYYRGRELAFTQDGDKFVSERILNGSNVYVVATEKFDAYENVKVSFIPCSNTNIQSSVKMNFYKISKGNQLDVSNTEGEDKEFFVSSSLNSDRKCTFMFKISGVSTISGISIKNDNEKFEFSNLTVVETGEDEDEPFVVAQFSVELRDYDFEDKATFCFEHVSGKVSDNFVVNSFIPLQAVSISNNDKAAANAFNERSENQSYIISAEGVVEKDLTAESLSLSGIMLEAGTSLPLLTDTRNATLSNAGVEYKFLTYDMLKSAIKNKEGLTDDDEEQIEKLASAVLKGEPITTVGGEVSPLDYVVLNLDLYGNFMTLEEFEALGQTYFSVSANKLVLNDKEFKGIVCVVYNGYDNAHDARTVLRFFTIESFYKVTHLSSNVETAKLYTTETLSETDMARASVFVTLTLRNDGKVPTYTNDLSLITFISANNEASGNAYPFENGSDDGSFNANQATLTSNGFYTISDIGFALSGRAFKFKITANSTKLQGQVRDILKIVYLDENGFKKEAEVQIEIQNVKRLETIEWTTRTIDNEIYFNTTSNDGTQQEFTISTSFTPSDANDPSLYPLYIPLAGNTTDLDITFSSIGQTINLTLSTEKGGYGYLYLLPSDMVKTVSVGGLPHLLLYKYEEDANGQITETPVLKPLSQIMDYYEQLVDESKRTTEFDQYFLNNDGKKIYYKDLILQIRVTIADGSSEEMALRLYSQSDLEDINTGAKLYYEVMNDIVLSGWETLSDFEFKGTLFGTNEDVTLTFDSKQIGVTEQVSGQLFRTIASEGVVRDLTLAGKVSGTGFVADVNKGTIENVDINVYYENGVYLPSIVEFTGTGGVGTFVGHNIGSILNSNSYGVSINAECSYVGGVAGKNSGLISGCGVEFYDFVDASEIEYKNTFKVETAVVGGIVGSAAATSRIQKSYVYAYSLAGEEKDISSIFVGTSKKAAFMAEVEQTGATVEESFAYLGTLGIDYTAAGGIAATVKNSYITCQLQNGTNADGSINYDVKSIIYNHNGAKTELTETEIGNSVDWSNLQASLSKTIWELDNIDSGINFGFMHLKNVKQSEAKEVSDLSIQNITEPYTKALNSGLKTVDDVDYESGILFAYDTVLTVSDAAELSVLTSLNTIYLEDLFGVTDAEAESLLLTSSSRDISISKNSIRVLSSNLTEFDLVVHSKMNFASEKVFKVVILNNLPKVTMIVDGQQLQNKQVLLLQTGSVNTRNVVFSLDNSIYLGGREFYAAEVNDYDMYVTLDGLDADSLNVAKSLNGQKLNLTGIAAHENNATTAVQAQLKINGLEEIYNDVVKEAVTNEFAVSVFDGATSLVINDTDGISLKPSEFASFEVLMQTDEISDNIVLSLEYDKIEILDEDDTDNYAKFVVDGNLALEISWTESVVAAGASYLKTFNVLVKVSSDTKHLVDKAYQLNLNVNASSLRNDERYLKTLPVNIKTQDISDVDVMVYDIKSRQIKNSVLYLTASTSKTNTLAPSSDAIVAVVVDPAYAMMTHFTLTYSLSGNSGAVGSVNISKLAYNETYGYYVNATGTSFVENGIKANITSTDKTGKGVYYFRVYVSGAFESSSDLKLILNYYNNETSLKTANYYLTIDFLAGATVKVNGASNYIMAKGSAATVTVTVGLDQDLYNLSLQNNAANISLSAWKVDLFETYKQYTATLVAYVDAELSNGQTSGVFYVVASVARTINGELELKTSRASVYLVDFAVDGSKTKVNSSGATSTYNGQTYDVFYAYISATDTLSFDYSILPEEYFYNSADNSEVELVKELTRKQNQFARDAYYRDDNSQYYINYKYNEKTGLYDAITLKQQLSYVTGTDSYTKIHNGTYFVKNYSNDIFDIKEDASSKSLKVTGTRTGKQLMRLQTTIICQGVEFVYDYYFLIVVEVYSDEDAPTQITTGEQFVEYVTKSEKADDYILMNDIVLENYTPVDTDLIDSLDGNGYTIHLNSYAPQDGDSLELALFNEVTENTTLKNVRVNVYGSGQINVDINKYDSVKIAGFALENYGIIYNCEVVSYFDDSYQTFKRSNNGIVVNYTKGENTDPIEITEGMGISSNVAGFVDTNNGSIMNSRVGGENFKHIVNVNGVAYIQTQESAVFEIVGQGNVSGFIIMNGTTLSNDEEGVLDVDAGYISACFVRNVQINNNMNATTSVTAGFVVHNYNDIQGSYVEGKGEYEGNGAKKSVYNTLTNLSGIGYIAGFVYENDGLVKNSYANIAIDSSESKASYVAGFVYKNNENGEVTLCFAACKISTSDTNEMQFSGVDALLETLNEGSITTSYYYNKSAVDTTNEKQLNVGPLAINDLTTQDTFYGFSFASGSGAYDGIWLLENQTLSLVSANQIAISNRYAVTTGTITSIFYNKSVLDSNTLENIDLSYGSINNPIIIRSAEEFAKATGKATTKEISSYKEYYNDREVFGNYRLVNNIIMSEIDQNADEDDNLIKLTTTSKKFSGVLDGNGFTISDISLGSSEVVENYGLFAKLENSVIMNLNLIVDSIHNKQANIVGTLAGTAVNSRIMAINIAPLKGSSETSIFGNNVVGGVVGMLFGESKIHDITSRNVTVYSSYNQDGKTIGSNNGYIGMSLRNLVRDDASLVKNVSKISYAGAVVGYADIYTDINSSGIKFTTSPDVSNFNIVTVHVYNSVDIYAEVAGGLFGYVGPTTSVYDAVIELNADMNLTNPSYIISKNLYAGGLVGENYGVLFGSYASYTEELQDRIELEANGYYTSGTAERGQLSIFSYASVTENSAQNSNNPLFVGGLVGYMGSGYIYVAYSKLNVISNSDKTEAVGGIIGYADNTGAFTNIEITDETIRTDIFLYDVYSSGDVYVKNSNEKSAAAGIIGAIHNQTVLTMKDVLAVNYLSYEGTQLTADVGVLSDKDGDGENETYTASKHFMLIGRAMHDLRDADLLSSVYILNSENDFYNLYTDEDRYSGAGTNTVGGYFKIVTGDTHVDSGEEFNLNLNPYGFYVKTTTPTAKLLEVTNIGKVSMKNQYTAHSQMYSFFLPVGWTAEFWEHESYELFPKIQLLPSTDVYYLDAIIEGNQESIENAEEILRLMTTETTITVVVRGKVDPDNIQEETCADVDLTLLQTFTPIQNFAGRLISYSNYANNDDNIGKVSSLYANKEDYKGGFVGNDVGIIINQSMFHSLDGATVDGVSFYLESSTEDVVKYSLISTEIKNSNFSDVDMVYNYNVERESDSSNIGLIAEKATNCIFSNIDFKLKQGVSKITVSSTAEAQVESLYMGLLAGTITQEAVYVQSSVLGVNVYRIDKSGMMIDDDEDNLVEINFKGNTLTVGDGKISVGNNNFYAGLYAGLIIKAEGALAKLSLGLSPLKNVRITLQDCGSVSTYVGGYAGQINGVDESNLLRNDEEGNEKNIYSKIEIVHEDVNEIYAGLAFGSAEAGGTLNFVNTSSDKVYVFDGGIYQRGETIGEDDPTYASTNIAHIGGLVGNVSMPNTSVTNLSVDFNIGTDYMLETKDVVDRDGETIKKSYSELRKEELSQNVTEYDEISTPYQIYGGSKNGENQFAAYFGNANGKVSMTGNVSISGIIDIKTVPHVIGENNEFVISAGTLAGMASGEILIDKLNCNNVMDFAIENYANAEGDILENASGVSNVGGLIGWVVDAGQEETKDNNVNISSTGNIHYTGNIVSNAYNLRAGGAIGYIERDDWQISTVSISNIVYGGAVKVYGESINGGIVAVGGVVGEYKDKNISATPITDTKFKVTDCYSYGDVFVNYDSTKNDKLNTYNFGGIIGASAHVTVTNNYSLMTSFNNRLSGTNNEYNADGAISENWAIGTYNVGAIVGENAEICNFSMDASSKNYYNSGVCLAYQEDSGNVDAIYAKEYEVNTYAAGEYLGYSSDDVKDGTNDDEISSTISLLSNDHFGQFVTEMDKKENKGSKLYPYLLGEEYRYINENGNTEGTSLDFDDETRGVAHCISWIAVTNNYEVDRVVVDTLSNAVVVGNGHTITRTDEKDTLESGYLGGFVNSLGTVIAAAADGATKIDFTAISGLVVKLDIDKNLNATSVYGGVAGAVSGNSYIFGVSVCGELTIGGAVEVDLAGIVGKMQGGFINECAVIANLLYRANESGRLLGIGRMENGNTTLKASYTIGRLETYVSEINVYALAHGMQPADSEFSHDVVNCYSASNIVRKDVTGNIVSGAESEGINYLLNSTFESGGNEYKSFQLKENFYVYGMNISADSAGTKKEVFKMAVGYTDTADRVYSLTTPQILEGAKEEDEKYSGESLTKWYFNPYVNYGFASHGFGYMKNVSTYTRKEDVVTITLDENNEMTEVVENSEGKTIKRENKDGSAVITDYAYQAVGYRTIFEARAYNPNWYLGVYNSAKFEQMAAAASKQSLKFVLTDDIVINNLTVEGSAYKNLGLDLMKGFELDGDNRTVDFEKIGIDNDDGIDDSVMSTGIFGSVEGSIINVKFNNVVAEIEHGNLTSNYYNKKIGLVANEITGVMNNVSAIGDLIVSRYCNKDNKYYDTYIGGIVGCSEGEITAVESFVNVTNYLSGVIMGGVTGFAASDVKYATNNGILISQPDEMDKGNDSILSINNSLTIGDDFGVESGVYTKYKMSEVSYRDKTEFYSSGTIHSIVGGVVGYAGSSAADAVSHNVSYSYNTNAVLSGYATSENGNYIAGGVVGYVGSSKISNCYNSGLVGAGNYSCDSSNRSFAGGIFGYGEEKTTVSDSSNDGAVEAIGQMSTSPERGIGSRSDNGDYVIKTEIVEGSHAISDYQTDPAKLKLKITMVYNPNALRGVFAYGIGCIGTDENGACSGKIENCVSSTENIKNDGNIGQVSNVQYMEFDRAAMLANNDAKEYKASFAIVKSENDDGTYNMATSNDDEPQIYVNGVDSYAFPARIYIKDIMTRAYTGLAETLKSEIGSSTIKGENLKRNLDSHAVNYAASIASNGLWKEDINSTVGNVNLNTNFFTDDEYNMKAQEAKTEYYSSVAFVEYDAILAGEYSIGILGRVGSTEAADVSFVNDLGTVSNHTDEDERNETDSRVSVDTALTCIDNFKSSFEEAEEVVVNGKNVIVLHTGDQLFASYNPNYFKVEFAESELTSKGIDVSQLTKNNFAITSVTGTSGEVLSKMQISVIKKEQSDDGSYKWCVYGYFAENVDASNATVKISYTATQSVILGNNNIEIVDDKTRIWLVDNNENLKSLVESFKAADTQESGTKNTFKALSIGGVEQEGLGLENLFVDETSKLAYFEAPAAELSAAELNGKTFEISYVGSKKLPADIEAEINATLKEAVYKIESTSTTTLTFKNFEKKTGSMGSYVSVNGSTATVNLSGLRSALGNPNQIVIGPSSGNQYGIYYKNGNWAYWGIDSYGTVNLSGETMTVIYSQASNATTLSNATVWHEKTGTIQSDDKITGAGANITKEVNGITFGLSGITVGNSTNTNFGKSGDYGIYSGSNFAGETSAVESTTELKFGSNLNSPVVTFYTKEVAYSSTGTIGTVTVTNSTEKTVGYTLEVKNASDIVTHFYQGDFTGSGDNSIELINLEGNSTITVLYCENATMYYAGNNVTEDERYFYKDSSEGETFELLLSSKNNENLLYLVQKMEVSACSYCNNECEAIRTYKAFTKQNIMGDNADIYAYIYTYYSCGAFELEYQNPDNANQNMKFVYSDGSLKKYTWDGKSLVVSTTEVKSETQAIIRKYLYNGSNYTLQYYATVTLDINTGGYTAVENNSQYGSTFSKISESEEIITQIIYWGAPTTIQYYGLQSLIDANSCADNKLDVIVGGVDENCLHFAYLDSGVADNLKVDAERNVWEENTESSISIGMYYDTSIFGSEIDLNETISEADENYDSTSIKYALVKENGVEVDEPIIKNSEISEAGYGVYDYEYYYDTYITEADNSDLTWKSGERTYGYAYLAEDLSFDQAIGENYMVLFGNNKNIKYYASEALFNLNSNIMQNTKLIGSISLINTNKTTENTCLTVSTNNGIMQNVSYYGNIRNASIKNAEVQDVKNVTLFKINKETMNNIVSNIAVTSLANISFTDVTEGDDIGEEVSLSTTNYSSKNIVIVADGNKGLNGTQNEEDKDGKDGGVGGSVTTNNLFTGIAKAGLGGLGGYGANGAAATMSSSGTLTNATGGGAPGWSGENGSVSADSGTKLSSRAVKHSTQTDMDSLSEDFETMQSGGNGGYGAVGQMSTNGKWVVSSAGAGSGGFVKSETEGWETKTINETAIYRVAGENANTKSSTTDGTVTDYRNIYGIGNWSSAGYTYVDDEYGHRTQVDNGLKDALEYCFYGRVLGTYTGYSADFDAGNIDEVKDQITANVHRWYSLLFNTYGSVSGNGKGFSYGKSVSDSRIYISAYLKLNVTSDAGWWGSVENDWREGDNAVTPPFGFITGLFGFFDKLFGGDYDIYHYATTASDFVIWTSGETLNSAGAAGYAHNFKI